MPEITGGRVAYSRTIQPAQYESKRVEAELAFVVSPGEDPKAVLAEVGEMARAAALELAYSREAPSAEVEHSDDEPPRRHRFRRREPQIERPRQFGGDDIDDKIPF